MTDPEMTASLDRIAEFIDKAQEAMAKGRELAQYIVTQNDADPAMVDMAKELLATIQNPSPAPPR